MITSPTNKGVSVVIAWRIFLHRDRIGNGNSAFLTKLLIFGQGVGEVKRQVWLMLIGSVLVFPKHSEKKVQLIPLIGSYPYTEEGTKTNEHLRAKRHDTHIILTN